MRSVFHCKNVSLVGACILLIFFSCKSAPPPEAVGAVVTTDSGIRTSTTDIPVDIASNSEPTQVPDGAVELTVPEQVNTEYFYAIPQEVMSLVYKGSPASLTEAAVTLRKSGASITDVELTLLSIITDITKVLYPTEPITWTTVSLEDSVIDSNAYLSAVKAAKNGVYDLSAGSSDFLLLVLPSLVLKTTPTLANYFNESEVALNQALSLHPDSVMANYLYAILLERSNRKSESIATLQKAYEFDTSCYQVSLDYVQALYNISDYQTCNSIVNELFLRYPTDISVLKLCAQLSFIFGDIASSEEYVARVLQKEPENSFFVLFRTKILMQKGEYIKASSLLDVYSRTDKTAKDYLLLRAKLQRDWNKNLTAATVTIQEALTRYPDDIDVLIFAAEISDSSGLPINNESASHYVERILAKEPENITALEIQVSEAVRRQNWQEAWNAGTIILNKNAASDAFKLQYINICLQLNKLDEAQFIADSLYNAHPEDENAAIAYIRILIARLKISDAKTLIDSLLPTASSRFKSLLYYERSRITVTDTQQLADLRSSLTANPRNEESLYDLYQFYYEKEDYRKAQYYLKQVVALNPSNERLLKLNSDLDNLLAR